MTAPVDTALFVDAFAEITHEVIRPYVVTPQEKRFHFKLRDDDEVFTVNTEYPTYRLYAAVQKFCQRRNLDIQYAGPIWIRACALGVVVNALMDEEQFRPYVQVDAASEIVAVRNDVLALAASFPLRSDKTLFDPGLFLEELLRMNEESKNPD